MASTAPSRATLADLLDAVKAAPMTNRRRQDTTSALHTIGRALGRGLADIPLEIRELNARLKQVSPIAMGITTARWSNVKSLFRSALALAGPMMRGRHKEPMSNGWADLHAHLRTHSDRVRLSKLSRWLTLQQISPATVTAEDLERFHRSICGEALLRDPEYTWADTSRAWNRAVRYVPGWPQLAIARPSRQKKYVLPWSAFPASLKADVDRWGKRLGDTEISEDGPSRPVSASTLATREYQIRAFATGLILRGRDAQGLTSLTECLTVENFKEGLRFFLERNISRRTIFNLATGLKSIARHSVHVDEATLARMSKIIQSLTVERTGMTSKNRDRLRPFDDTATAVELLNFPKRLRQVVESAGLPPRRIKILAQVAVAIEILIFAPIRIGNLATLKINHHLLKVGKKLHLVIPASEVKNRVDIEFEFPDECADLINWYINQIRIAPVGNTALFPGTTTKTKAICTLRHQIIQTVRKYTGLYVNPHLFRHLMSTLYLGENPGGYEIVRRVLGHKQIATTMNHYAGQETRSAARHFDKEILKLRSRQA